MNQNKMNFSIRRTVFAVSAIVIVSKLVGFLREVVIAEQFGTSREYDIFLLAISAPLFFQLVVMRATNFLTVPLLSKKSTDNNYQNNRHNLWSLFNSLFFVALFLTLAVIPAAPYFVRWIGTGLAGDKLDQAIFFCRAISVTILLGFLEAFLRSALNVKKQFAYPAAGTIILNLTVIGSIYLFSEKISVAAILVGLAIGLFLQVIFLLLRLWNGEIFESFNLKLFGPGIRKALAVGGLIMMVELMMTTFFLIDRYFASDLSAGAVAAIKYAGVLVMLPVSVVGFTIAAVTFPYISEKAETRETGEFASLVNSSLSLALVLALPCGLFYYMFSSELVTAVFYYGAFDLTSVAKTAMVLKMFAPYLVCLFLYTLLIQACYSSGRARFVFYLSLMAMIVKFFLTWLFKIYFDFPGIALATSVTHLLILMIFFLYLFKKSLLSGFGQLSIKAGKVVLAALPIILLGLVSQAVFDTGSTTDWLSRFQVVPAAIVSFLLFIIFGRVLKIDEIISFLGGLKNWRARMSNG